ncbi:MAG: type II toxin-antitoxin system PemK/MazF family toxin [Bacteroidota bacterium]
MINPTTLNGIKVTSEVLTFHVRPISKSRLKKHVGTISKLELKETQTCLNELLTY